MAKFVEVGLMNLDLGPIWINFSRKKFGRKNKNKKEKKLFL